MAAYYNEIDPFAAAWLRELIKAGLIADGEVDERSIEFVRPGDVRGFTQCHFFAGIGGWSYALRLAGWPDNRAVWTGSCPCQPFSQAGKGASAADTRHLWPAWYVLIRQCQPGVVFGEQVASADGLAWIDLISTDMENAHYAIGAIDLCAAGVRAPFIRQRLFFVADADREGFSTRHVSREPGAPSKQFKPWREFERVHAARDWKSREAQSDVPVFTDGLPNRVGTTRGFGNAIVPQVAAEFIKAYDGGE